MTMKKLAVYCSASGTIDQEYNEVARQFVRAASLSGYALVSGGTVKGTMGVICDETADCGGYHIGIIPRFMESLAHPRVNETVIVETMSERKALMREGTVASIALPGGIGTLDEIIEAFTLKKLGKYQGEIIFMNCKGFYDPVISLLDYYVETEMLGQNVRDIIHTPSTVEELMDILSRYCK